MIAVIPGFLLRLIPTAALPAIVMIVIFAKARKNERYTEPALPGEAWEP